MVRSAIYPPSVQPGRPRLGTAPAGWTTVAFGDVLEIVERPADIKDDEVYQLVTAKRSRGGIVPRSNLSGREILTKTQFEIREGDFLISRRQIIHGGCGFVPPALDGAIVSNEYSTLRPKCCLLPEFFHYYQHSVYFQQTCFHASVGVDVEKMVFDIDEWLTFKMHLPPPAEQAAIADILARVDDAIEATRAVIEQTRKVKQGLLRHLLTRGIGHTRFKQTEIGEIPEAWEVKRIDQLGHVHAGRQRSPHFTKGEFRPYLRVANVFDGFIDNSDVLQMPFTGEEFIHYQLLPGDILLNEGQSIELVGRNAVYQGDPPQCCFQNTLIRFRANENIDEIFASVLLTYLFHDGRYRGIAARTTSVAHLGVSRFSALLVPVPPRHEQIDIAGIYRKAVGATANAHVELSTVHRLASALMADLLTGRVRVAA